MKRMSEKRRKREAEARPFRKALIARVGECEACEASPEYPHRGMPPDMSQLCVHEIANGPNRQKALDKPYAVLVLCAKCNLDDFEDKSEWPEARQLALLAQRRLLDFDLVAYLELTSPRAPNRITIDEVAAYMPEERLKVTDVANILRVNRKTVQSWITSGELAATDVRPSGAKTALWRIEYADLLDFQRRRKYSERKKQAERCENLLD